MRWRSSGKRGRFGLAIRLPTADSLCSLKVARASKISADGNFRRSLVGSLRALTSSKLVIGKAIQRPVLASSSPRSIRSQRESAVGRRITRRGVVPVCPKTAPHASAATTNSFVPHLRAVAACPRGGKDRETRCSGSGCTPRSCDSFPSSANGDVLHLLAHGASAVWVGARSEG